MVNSSLATLCDRTASNVIATNNSSPRCNPRQACLAIPRQMEHQVPEDNPAAYHALGSDTFTGHDDPTTAELMRAP
jgi:hypothetical protein